MELAPALWPGGQEVASSTLGILAEFSASITSSLDLELVIRSVLDSTYRLVPADVLELNIWDRATGGTGCLPPAGGQRHTGKIGAVRRGAIPSSHGSNGRTRQPFILSDSSALGLELGDSRCQACRRTWGSRLLLAMTWSAFLTSRKPLSASSRCTNSSSCSWSRRKSLLPSATPFFMTQERRRALEYSGLAGVSQAVGAIRQPEELFGKLVEAVAPLFDAQIFGFLLYDETRQVLEAQVPFRGLPHSHCAHVSRPHRARRSRGRTTAHAEAHSVDECRGG